MPNATDRGPSALRNFPSLPDGNADVVAQSIGVAPAAGPPPPPSGPEPKPHPAATVPVQVAPVISVHRKPVMIDHYESVVDAAGSPILEERVVRTFDPEGRPLDRIVQSPAVKVTCELAYIGDDRTATLVDGSLAGIPEGPGLPGHYGRPKSPGGGDRSRTLHGGMMHD
jgi:hypothetical protein